MLVKKNNGKNKDEMINLAECIRTQKLPRMNKLGI